MSDERCVHDLLPGECGICQPRAGSIDLHSHGRPASGTGYAEEIIDTVYIDDRSYGLVPSAGQAYVFGAGRVLHHRAEAPRAGTPHPNESNESLILAAISGGESSSAARTSARIPW